MIRVGTSGWSYEHWDGAFYPDEIPKRRWVDHYRTVFPTVEINATHYRLPTSKMVDNWRAAPPGFRYVAKGSRLITHMRRIADCRDEVATFLDRIAPLRSYLGALLWQLPPNLERDDERLEAFLQMLPRRVGGSPVRHAVEFRHRSWLAEDVFALLERRRATHVWVSSTDMPGDTTHTGDLVYLRLHGLEGGYAHDYTDHQLDHWVAALRRADDDGLDGYVFFNNDGGARAPHNALRLIERLADRATEWP